MGNAVVAIEIEVLLVLTLTVIVEADKLVVEFLVDLLLDIDAILIKLIVLTLTR